MATKRVKAKAWCWGLNDKQGSTRRSSSAVRWSSMTLTRNIDGEEGRDLVTMWSRYMVVRLLLGEVTRDHLLGEWRKSAARTK